MWTLIELLIVLLAIFILAYAADMLIKKFEMPQPTRFVVGAILIVALVIYAAMLLTGETKPVFIRRGML